MAGTRIAIYARVSTRDGRQDADNQVRQLREFCARQSWDIVAEYVDEASGKRSDRPQFQQMLQAASKREFDVLLFWALDRLTREGALATLRYLELLTSYQVGYRSFMEAYLDSVGPFRDAVVAILASVARQERLRLSERVTAGLARAKREGRTGGRPRASCDRDRIHALRQSGHSLGQIAALVGVSKMTISRILASNPSTGR
jgi:DNA invertase Pin-like site-specific DNA recombinase